MTIKRSTATICLFLLLALPLIAQAQEKKTYTCASAESRRGTARMGRGAGARNVQTVETEIEKTSRFLPCDVPDGVSIARFEGNARDGFDAVLAAINGELKKKKQLTLEIDPAANDGLSKRQAKYLAGGYRVEDLLNSLCSGTCEWQIEEQGEARLLVVSPLAAATAS
ncbi:MAG TPA: hypothetical protein VEL74_24810 [Thermoanaerobaculia bacterium]|nr:hypothetical protein [Thermoanaerobaculia bacterium]